MWKLFLVSSIPQSPARGPDPAREGFQSDPRAFLEMFRILTISCKWINVRCNFTKLLKNKEHLLYLRIFSQWALRYKPNKPSLSLGKDQLQTFWSLLAFCVVEIIHLGPRPYFFMLRFAYNSTSKHKHGKLLHLCCCFRWKLLLTRPLILYLSLAPRLL